MGSDDPEEAAGKALQAHWDKVDKMLAYFKDKCQAAKVKDWCGLGDRLWMGNWFFFLWNRKGG